MCAQRFCTSQKTEEPFLYGANVKAQNTIFFSIAERSGRSGAGLWNRKPTVLNCTSRASKTKPPLHSGSCLEQTRTRRDGPRE